VSSSQNSYCEEKRQMNKFIILLTLFILLPFQTMAKDFPDAITEVKNGMTLAEVEAVLGAPIAVGKPTRPDDDAEQTNKVWVDFYHATECRVYLRKPKKVSKRNYSWLIVIYSKDVTISFNARLHPLPYCNGDFRH